MRVGEIVRGKIYKERRAILGVVTPMVVVLVVVKLSSGSSDVKVEGRKGGLDYLLRVAASS